MSDESGDQRDRAGRLTTTIPRPAQRRASDAGRSRLGVIPRRDGRTDRISTRRSRWLFGLAAIVIALAIGAALFALPVRTWLDQDQRIDALEFELDEVQDVNTELDDEVARLQTDEGVIEAAREDLGMVMPGEQRRTVLELPPLPRNVPAGWPYVHVGQLLDLREREANQPIDQENPE